ncbi:MULTISPECIES: hypothetical protein [Acinetobacter]|uniref:hypothetical protein n=1 Tax=Acinetobacter TaxID=469 RepID=UPI00099442E5|nr:MULTISPECIES: hypothetical protein [Acinetobacter]MCL6244317.1 hypothetical protein [Acinetobacter amyesii]OOV82801.1 hypothetical protein B1201_03850 [Acinetobacter sp. ANC 5600]
MSINFRMIFLYSALAASSLCTAMPVLYSMDFPQEKKAEEKEFLATQDQIKAESKSLTDASK